MHKKITQTSPTWLKHESHFFVFSPIFFYCPLPPPFSSSNILPPNYSNLIPSCQPIASSQLLKN